MIRKKRVTVLKPRHAEKRGRGYEGGGRMPTFDAHLEQAGRSVAQLRIQNEPSSSSSHYETASSLKEVVLCEVVRVVEKDGLKASTSSCTLFFQTFICTVIRIFREPGMLSWYID
jgi:hypothetical protein